MCFCLSGRLSWLPRNLTSERPVLRRRTHAHSRGFVYLPTYLSSYPSVLTYQTLLFVV